MGARPRQGICLLLNRPRLFQGYAEALVLRRETGAYPFAKRAEGAPLSTPLGSDWPSRNTIETVFYFRRNDTWPGTLNATFKQETNER
jgi:hypothetical protein